MAAVQNEKVVLAYWKFRGLAQTLRMLLVQAGVEFEDKFVTKESWAEEKPTMGPLANLPYLKEGDKLLTESWAIGYYLSEKYGFMGDNLEEKTKVLQYVSFIRDLKQRMYQWCYYPREGADKETWLKGLPEVMARIATALGEDEFFAVPKVNWAHFEAYEFIKASLAMDEKCIDGQPTLKALVERTEALPKIKEFMASPTYVA